jgi:hypothetical protein
MYILMRSREAAARLTTPETRQMTKFAETASHTRIVQFHLLPKLQDRKQLVYSVSIVTWLIVTIDGVSIGNRIYWTL